MAIFSRSKPGDINHLAAQYVAAEERVNELKRQRTELLASILEAEDSGGDASKFRAGLQGLDRERDIADARVKRCYQKIEAAVRTRLEKDIKALGRIRKEYQTKCEAGLTEITKAIALIEATGQGLGLSSQCSELSSILFQDPYGRPVDGGAEMIRRVREAKDKLTAPDYHKLGGEIRNLEQLGRDVSFLKTQVYGRAWNTIRQARAAKEV